MKKLLILLAALALALGMAGSTFASDEGLPHSGRVLIVADGDVSVAEHEQADAVIVLGGDAHIAGTVNTLVVIGGTATTSGAELETVVAINSAAHLTHETTVRGDVLRFDSTVERADSVHIGGSVKDMTGDIAAFAVFIGAAALAIWIGVGVATLLAGLLTAGLAARQVRMATALIGREPWTVALVGLLSLIVPLLVGALAIVTVIGIPAGVGLLFVVWPMVAFIGYIVAAIWLGEFLLYRRAGSKAPDRPYAAATIGLLVAFVVGLVPLATAILSIFGLGAVVLAALRTLRGGPRAEPMVEVRPATA